MSRRKKKESNKRPESYRSRFFKTTQVKKIEEELFCMGNEERSLGWTTFLTKMLIFMP